MLAFAITYRKAIDAITAHKALKLRRFELDEEDWGIIQELVDILEVRVASSIPQSSTNINTFV
jgi:hypothetical protein